MSKSIAWLEQFTGLPIELADPPPGGGIADQSARFEQRQRRQQVMLQQAHEELGAFKGRFQDAMAVKLKSGEQRGMQLLKEGGTAISEVDAKELSVADIGGTKEGKAMIAEGAVIVQKCALRLEEAMFTYAGEAEALFTEPELIALFWTPITRERILPETYIPARFSETQKMIDETNKAYLAQIEERKSKGTLTDKPSRGRRIMDSALDVVNLGTGLAGNFAPGSKEAKLALAVIDTTVAVIRKGAEVYDASKAGKYGDAASLGLEAMGLVVVSVLTNGTGIDKDTIKSVSSGFAAGSTSIKVGVAFAQGMEGAEEGLTLLSSVIERALEIGIANTSDPSVKRALGIAKASVPAAFRQGAIALNLRQHIYDENYAGIVECLGKSFGNALGAVQAIRSIEQTRGKSDEKAKEIEANLAKETQHIETLAGLAEAGLQISIKAALAAKRGELLGSLNGIIDDIGGQLVTVLRSAGLPKEQAAMIGQCYVAASSATKAFECLASKGDVPGALSQLSGGVLIAFQQAAPGDSGLQAAGKGLSMAIAGMGKGIAFKAAYDEGDYAGAIETFNTGIKEQLKGAFNLGGLESDDEEEDGDEDQDQEGDDSGEGEGEEETPSIRDQAESLLDGVAETAKKIAEGTETAPDPKEALAEIRRAAALVKKGGKLGKNLEKARKELEAAQKEADEKAMREEAQELLDEADADLSELSEAQLSGAEASSIDKLIAKIEKERLVLELAVQITSGGASFLAQFVPALGAVSVGIKLAAQMHAAGKRAEHLYYWMQNQDDLSRAQSGLSSAAQNFVRNQAQQLAHYAAQAVFAATQLAAKIAELSGVAAPIAKGIEAGAVAAASLEEIIYKNVRAEELETAWKITVKALRNPSNRRLGLEARKLNGSLAKYTIAWGAVVKKDPLARNAMKSCNLNEAALNNPDSNVDKVVQYLETLYVDDPQLYRELETAPAWVSDDLSLSLSDWTRLKRRASAEGGLLSVETGKLSGLLAEIDALPEDVSWEAAEVEVQKFKAALLKAKPTPGSKPVLPDTKPVRDALTAVETELRARARLFEQAAKTLEAYVPAANPAATPKASPEQQEINVKAMGLAVRTLAKQAHTGKKAADVDMQRVTTELLAIPTA